VIAAYFLQPRVVPVRRLQHSRFPARRLQHPRFVPIQPRGFTNCKLTYKEAGSNPLNPSIFQRRSGPRVWINQTQRRHCVRCSARSGILAGQLCLRQSALSTWASSSSLPRSSPWVHPMGSARRVVLPRASSIVGSDRLPPSAHTFGLCLVGCEWLPSLAPTFGRCLGGGVGLPSPALAFGLCLVGGILLSPSLAAALLPPLARAFGLCLVGGVLMPHPALAFGCLVGGGLRPPPAHTFGLCLLGGGFLPPSGCISSAATLLPPPARAFGFRLCLVGGVLLPR